MNATSNNVGEGYSNPLPVVSGLREAATHEDGAGRDALQALLAFACLHVQAVSRRQHGGTDSSAVNRNQEQFGLDEVLRMVAARAFSITGADGVAIALAEQDAIVCRAACGRIAPDVGVRLDPNSGFSGACLRSGQTVRCDDSETDVRVNAQACRMLSTRSMIAVPLTAKQRVVGLIEAFSSEPFGFNDSDVRSLNLLGELILAAIRPEEEDRLAELATVVVPQVAPPEQKKEGESAPERPAATAQPSGIIVDEKFAPAQLPENPPAAALKIPVVAETQSRLESQLSEKTKPLPAVERWTSNIVLTAALVITVIGLGAALVWKGWNILHAEQGQSISANTQPVSRLGRGGTDLREPAPEQAQLKPGATPQVTGIRHWSSAESSTVVIDLEDQVQYEAHSLDNPSRIYFDLHDTKMAPGLLNQSIEVNDVLLKRVRMAQPVQDITRVVLETKGEFEFSVKLDSNPYRLTIEVHNVAGKPALGTLSKPSPAVTVQPRKKVSSSESAIPAEFRIVLDAGHGGWDLGTVGRKGLLEKNLVLDIVQRLGHLVESRLGAEVVYTRQDDSYLPLEKRAEIANLAKANLFLSVHANYSDLTTARGVETYYTNTYSSLKARTADYSAELQDVNWTGVDIREKVMGSRRLASEIQQALYGGLASRNPQIRNRGVKEAQYVVLTGTQMPAVLAEVSFVSSPADEDKLQSSEYRQTIAEALYGGVAKYRNEARRTKLARKILQ